MIMSPEKVSNEGKVRSLQRAANGLAACRRGRTTTSGKIGPLSRPISWAV
jgi:hypothetical protein